jgi:hypothetical protein
MEIEHSTRVRHNIQADRWTGLLFGLLAGLTMLVVSWGLDGWALDRAEGILPWAKAGLGAACVLLPLSVLGWLSIGLRCGAMAAVLWLLAGVLSGWLAAQVAFRFFPWALARWAPDAARLNALAGLLEHVVEEGGRADQYRLSDDLVMELDDLLPVVEASELLGLAAMDEGDISATPLGAAFAEASILTRKELLAGRALRLPTIRWIYETLQRDDKKRMPADYFLERLRLDFGDYAESQMQAAINWGRYAELFASRGGR